MIFTGAADTGVQFKMNGYETLVVLGLQNLEKVINNVEVTVVTTESRSLSSKKACEIIK